MKRTIEVKKDNTHQLEKETRATVRGHITTIRCRHNVNRAEAEMLFNKALSGHSAVSDALYEEIDDIIRDEKDI